LSLLIEPFLTNVQIFDSYAGFGDWFWLLAAGYWFLVAGFWRLDIDKLILNDSQWNFNKKQLTYLNYYV
jgi:hypothetical protein